MAPAWPLLHNHAEHVPGVSPWLCEPRVARSRVGDDSGAPFPHRTAPPKPRQLHPRTEPRGRATRQKGSTWGTAWGILGQAVGNGHFSWLNRRHWRGRKRWQGQDAGGTPALPGDAHHSPLEGESARPGRSPQSSRRGADAEPRGSRRAARRRLMRRGRQPTHFLDSSFHP